MIRASVVVLARNERTEFLWVKRPHEHPFLGGYWAFVGGGETDADRETPNPAVTCARRELSEELGLELAEERFEKFGTWTTPKMFSIRYESSFFIVDLDSSVLPNPENAIDHEAIDAEWVSVEVALARIGDATRVVSPPIRLTIDLLSKSPFDLELERDDDHLDIRAYEVHENLFAVPLPTLTLPPAETTNAVVVGGPQSPCWIVDPGTDVPEDLERLYRFIEEHGGTPTAVILTHHHPDHILGAPAVSQKYDVPIWAHHRCAEHVEFKIDRPLRDGDVVDDGNTRWEVMHTPGHASDHIVLVSEKSVIGGDLIASFGTIWINPPDGHMGDYLESLQRIESLHPLLLVPAHGWVIPEPEFRLRHYVKHRLAREEKIFDAIAELEVADAAQIVPVAYVDTPKKAWPFALRTVEAHLQHLDEIGRITKVDGGWSIVP